MSFKRIISINAVLYIAAGLFLLFAGAFFSIWHGLYPTFRGMPSEARVIVIRLWHLLRYGGGMLLFACGWLVWLHRDQTDTKRQHRLAHALFVIAVYGTYMVFSASGSLSHNAFQPTRADWLSATIFLIPTALWLYWLLLGKTENATDAQLPADASALQKQWAQQISATAAQEERSRLARELHDSIKQQLFSINVSAATVQARWQSDADGAQAALVDVRDRVRDALTEMDVMLHNLRPAPLANFGLVEALRREAEALQLRTGVTVTTEFSELPIEQSFPPGAQETLFRIAQEALSNVARHARAQNVQLRLHHQVGEQHDAVWLRISDDGAGFSVAMAEGMGLANMRMRARQHGGALQLESSPGNGTKLIAQIPLQPETRALDKHPLTFAVLLTILGFLVFGLGFALTSRFLLILFGSSLFTLSALSYWRAARQIKQLSVNKFISWQRPFRLKLDWYYGLALFCGLASWSVMRWLVLIEGTSKSKIILWIVWNLNMPSIWKNPHPRIITIWCLPLMVIAYCIHRLVKAEAKHHSIRELQRQLAVVWKRYSLHFLTAIVGLLVLYWAFFLPLPFFLIFGLAILFYWVQLSWLRFMYREPKTNDEKPS